MPPSPPESTVPPDVVIVVLDCIREDAFAAAVSDPLRMHFLRTLESEVARYDQAIAPGSWTIPSHASLFTGMYPWDHGATYKTGLVLQPRFRTIATFLSNLGYATGSFSGNGLLQPGTGLTRGFGHSLWAGDREFFLRFLRLGSPSCRPLSLPGANWYSSSTTANESAFLGTLGNLSSRSLALWDGINRVGNRVKRFSRVQPQVVASWIEPELDKWLQSIPSSQPTFTFINLIEAHEPYLINGGDTITLRHWLRSLPMRNAQERWVSGRGTPSPEYISEFRRSYEKMLDALDRRVEGIVRILRTRRNWRNTLFILSSDHGQSFWENELLGHRMLVTDSLARVPLWIKPPEGRSVAAKHHGWCSLTDVPATIALCVNGEPFGDSESVDLLADRSNEGSRSVYVLADGLTHSESSGMKPERRAALDQTRIAAYRGLQKVVVELGRPSVVELPVGSAPRIVGSDDREDPIVREIESAASARIAMISSNSFATTTEELGRRLAGWGY
jgi:arylsulfatase A-like enzyme